jgi:hypothetical protein
MKYVLERTEANGDMNRNVIECAIVPRADDLVVFRGDTYKVSAVVHMLADNAEGCTTREVTVRAWTAIKKSAG